MAFKLRSGKTPTTFMEGTAPNKLAKEKAVAKMKQAAAAKKKMEDGRAGSSAFQQKSAEEGKKLRTYLEKVESFLAAGFSQKEAEQMVKDGASVPKNKKSKGQEKRNKNKDVVASKDKKPPLKQKVSQEDFAPAYPGADYSKEQIAKMTKKEKEQKIDGYDPKLDGVKKGKIVYKDGKKFYQASDGTLHTGQVEDYERELKADKEMKKDKKPPLKQKSKLLPSENPDTDVYTGNVYREKVNDLEDRISFIREDMFNERGDSVQQKKDIATLQKQLKTLKAKPPTKMKSPAKQVMEQPRKAPKYKRKPIPAPTGRTGYAVMEEPKNREFEPIVAGRRRPTKTKVGKFLSKITKRKKKK